MQFFVGLLLSIASVAHAASNFTFSNEPGPYAVGLNIVQQYDYSRAYKARIDRLTGLPSEGEISRPIQTLIWYPAKVGGKQTTYFDYVRTTATEENFDLSNDEIDHRANDWLKTRTGDTSAAQVKEEASRAMWAIQDAEPISGKFPLVVYAPSFSASAHENADLCEYLASQGYVVVASANMGKSSRLMTGDLEGVEAQAGDIAYLIGYAHTLPQADTAQIAVIGFSWGGISNVFAAAKDRRIKALVTLDGSVRIRPDLVAAAKYVIPDRLAVPLLSITARQRSLEELTRDKQDISSSLINDMKYSDVYQVTMYPMIHPYFASYPLRFLSASDFPDYSREEASLAYSWVARYVDQFLNAYLKNDKNGLAYLNNPPAKNGVPAHMLAINVHRSEGPPVTIELLAAELGKRGFEHATDVYQELHKKDSNFKPSEEELNYWGNRLSDRERYTAAIAILTLATTLYPESSRVFDSLAEAYERNQNKALAIKNFQHSLDIDSKNTHAVKHLKALGVAVGDTTRIER